MLYLTSVTCQGPQGLAEEMYWQTVAHVRRRKEYASKSGGSTLQVSQFVLILRVMQFLPPFVRDGDWFYCDAPVPDHVMANFSE